MSGLDSIKARIPGTAWAEFKYSVMYLALNADYLKGAMNGTHFFIAFPYRDDDKESRNGGSHWGTFLLKARGDAAINFLMMEDEFFSIKAGHFPREMMHRENGRIEYFPRGGRLQVGRFKHPEYIEKDGVIQMVPHAEPSYRWLSYLDTPEGFKRAAYQLEVGGDIDSAIAKLYGPRP